MNRNTVKIDTVIYQSRLQFESKSIDTHLLHKLYQIYNPIPKLYGFIQQAQSLFPHLNCGLASVYLRFLLGGEIKRGLYKNHKHTVLLLDQQIIDITADQFGGPSIYRGPIQYPWFIEYSEYDRRSLTFIGDK